MHHPSPQLATALDLAASIASERHTGNGAVSLVLQSLIAAYQSGQAGRLARFVAQWQAETGTREVGDVEIIHLAEQSH